MLVVAEREHLPLEQVQAARAGSSAAWDVLFTRYQLPLNVYAFQLVHDEQASLDVVQESFSSAVRYIHTLRDDQKFASWLFGIAHQKCIQRWRKQARDESLHEELAALPADFDADPLELLIRKEQEAEFMEMLNSLPLPQRSVLLLHFLEEFSLEEIAAITDTQIGTVKSRMHYAKKAFRRLIEKSL